MSAREKIVNAKATGRMGLVQYSRVLALIEQQPRTAAEVAEMRLGILLRQMRKAGQVHRCGWYTVSSHQGMPAEVLMLGRGRDAPRPPAMSEEMRQKRYRERRRARVATERVVRAIQGAAPISPFGARVFGALSGGCIQEGA